MVWYGNGMVEYIDFIVVDEQSQPIIGFETMIKLNLVKKLYEVNANIMDDPKYKSISEGIGLMKVEEYDFKIQPEAKLFTVLDASKGFWQLPLTLKSSKLTTFITPFGRNRFKRLPFGIKIAPEVFHKTFSRVLQI